MAEADYGTGLSALPGEAPDELFRPITGRRVLVESLARQLACPPGGLFWAPEKGIDLRAYLRARIDGPTLVEIRQRTLATLREDERVVDVRADVTFDAAAKRLRLALAVEAADGPFSFVLDVSAARVEVFGFTEG